MFYVYSQVSGRITSLWGSGMKDRRPVRTRQTLGPVDAVKFKKNVASHLSSAFSEGLKGEKGLARRTGWEMRGR